MKIECDKCAAKYSIADEKVRGKTFKIRCKKCSNVIIVRDKGGAAAAAEGPAPAADHAPGWHLAINGETVGPMPEDEVRQRYDAGEIDKETAVWQEGFEDWIPLSDVELFANLPDRAAAPAAAAGAAAAAEDPFASANHDDYAAPAAAVGSDLPAAAAPMEPAAADSPRVSNLTGQRNENSVLFSLDSLSALATGGGAAAAPAAAAPSAAAAPAAARAAANPAKGLATSAPSSEGSGLIDIRALGAMVGGGAASPAAVASPHPGAADDAALPSFGGGGLGGLAATPLVPAPAPADQAAAVAAAAPAAPTRSQAPLYIMMGLLLLAVAGLVAFVVTREPQERIVKETVAAPAAAPSVADKDDDKDDDKKDKDDGDKASDDKAESGDDGDKEGTGGEDEAADGEDEGEDGLVGSSTAKKKTKGKKGKKTTTKAGGDPLADAIGEPSTSTTKKKKSGGDPGIDCILDPSKCGGGSSTTTKKKKAVDSNLPEKLSATDIKNGVSPYKAAAKSCGGKHGGKSGEKVTIKLSISGSTGKVTAASATGTHAGTPLGNCVAAALKKAKFQKFQKSSLGVQYPIRL